MPFQIKESQLISVVTLGVLLIVKFKESVSGHPTELTLVSTYIPEAVRVCPFQI